MFGFFLFSPSQGGEMGEDERPGSALKIEASRVLSHEEKLKQEVDQLRGVRVLLLRNRKDVCEVTAQINALQEELRRSRSEYHFPRVSGLALKKQS